MLSLFQTQTHRCMPACNRLFFSIYSFLYLLTLITFFISATCMLLSSNMVEIRVPNLDCHGCASKIKRTLFKLKGVEEIEIEMEMQKIVVKGYGLEERKVLKAIKRTGKAAEPWPYPGYSSHFASFYKYPTHIANQYYYDRNEASGHNLHTFFHTPSVYSVAIASDEAVASLFSDENPHACAIM
ncbi:heavy metal-associated isoprenylated plant protein 31-like isoform X1 [Bidens hawaiensis]|uniref:heavy metal-associated isoprenylated plant protein 31-like isoform X1 n=1 Tax=Bidens hawaiensis TaxID=980011 RepID=UPI00404A76F5